MSSSTLVERLRDKANRGGVIPIHDVTLEEAADVIEREFIKSEEYLKWLSDYAAMMEAQLSLPAYHPRIQEVQMIVDATIQRIVAVRMFLRDSEMNRADPSIPATSAP